MAEEEVKKSWRNAGVRGKLTGRQNQFCHQYLVDFSTNGAAARSGYKGHLIGGALMKLPQIKARIAELQEEEKLSQKSLTDKVLQQYWEIASFKVTEISEFDGNVLTYMPFDRWPDSAIKAITSIKSDSAGKILEAKTADKTKALEFLAKHLGLSCDLNAAILTLRRYGLNLSKNTDGEWSLTDEIAPPKIDKTSTGRYPNDRRPFPAVKPVSDSF